MRRIMGLVVLAALAGCSAEPTGSVQPSSAGGPAVDVSSQDAGGRKKDLLRLLSQVSAPIASCQNAYTSIQKAMKRGQSGKASMLEVYADVQVGINACEEPMSTFEKMQVPAEIQGDERSALESSLKDHCPAAVGQPGSALRKLSSIMDQGGASPSEQYEVKQQIEAGVASKVLCITPFVTQAMAAGATQKDIESATGGI